jgi:hypothetical protein
MNARWCAGVTLTEPELRSIQHPTLLLFGTRDPVGSTDVIEQGASPRPQPARAPPDEALQQTWRAHTPLWRPLRWSRRTAAW